MTAVDPLSREQWSDPMWRLRNLYTITDDSAAELRFEPNAEQLEFYQRLHYRNLILKARQLGFTTFVDLMALDQCLFNRNFSAAIIAHSLDAAGKIFRTKVLEPYRKLPQFVREMVPLRREKADELVFENGSSISVSTSARSGTVQLLHVSEMGKIARKYPEKATEIVTGSFEAVPADGIIIVESTAEGMGGWFYEAVQRSRRSRDQRSKQTALDFRLHFFPWWLKASYMLDPEGVVFTDTDREYFAKLERTIGRTLVPAQRAWYVKKRDTQGESMLREYPSTEDEAFQANTDGMIYGKEMQSLRALGRIGKVPLREGIAVNTFWDLGVNDTNAIWLHQRVGAMNRFVRYLSASNEGMRYYWRLLESWREQHNAKWGRHFLPHDGDHRIQGYEVETRKSILEGLGAREVTIVPRIKELRDGIELTRTALLESEFDEEGCAEGIEALDNYSREWDEDAGRWSSRPRHDKYSNGADAYRQFAQAYRGEEGPGLVIQATGYTRAGW